MSEETIGMRLRRLRQERGLSQRDLATEGVSYAYISRIEAGTRQPSVKALRKLAARLDVSADLLETGHSVRSEEARELLISDAELELRIGDPAAAEAKLRELLAEARSAPDPVAVIRIRIALGLAAAAQARHDEAVEHLERVVEEGGASASTRPDVFSTLGFEYATLGKPERAVELFERCLSELGEDGNGDPAARVRFSTLLSYALSDIGELERAEHVLQDALDDAQDLTDAYAQVRINWSLARLESMQNRQAAALRHARKALALLESTEDTLHLARAHLLCGSILLIRGAAEAARNHLDLAERLLGPRPEEHDLASLRTEQAKAAAALGRGAQAVVLANEALAVLGAADPAERGQALWALAQGLALEADLSGADIHYRQAIELLNEQGRWRDVKLAAEAWAGMLDNAGREREAAAVRERYADAGAAAHAVER